MFNGIRLRLGYRALRRYKDTVRRGAMLRPLADVERIGLLVPSADSSTSEGLLLFAQGLERMGKVVEVCAYVPKQDLPGHLILRRGLTVLQPSDLDWLYRPKSEKGKAFCSLKLDYLIDFTLLSELPLEWVLRFSPAAIRIGFTENPAHDVTFAVRGQVDYKRQLKLLEEYLQ